MASGIWTAVSGATAQQQVIDTTANNLANADTQGFKRDQVTFREYMARHENPKMTTDIPRGPIKDKDLHPLDGKDQSMVTVEGTYSDFTPGHLEMTQNPLDLAIEGNGFLEVSTPQGIRYTRAGNLKIAADGKLVTSEGFAVLGSSSNPNAQPPAAEITNRTPANSNDAVQAVASRMIYLKDMAGTLSITKQGEILVGDQQVGKLAVTEFASTVPLRKVGAKLFENPENLKNQPTPATKSFLHQGMIERSNVNPVREMVNMIQAQRMYEADLKSIKTYSDLMSRESNDVGKL